MNSWGKIKNNCIDWKKEQFLKKYNEAPRLIPVYNHRYMPNIDKKRVPILSVVGSDIIVYGKDLQNYLEIEFELIKKEQYNDNKYDIEFWSEIR